MGDSNSSPRSAAASIAVIALRLSSPVVAHIAACVSSKIGLIGFPDSACWTDEITMPAHHCLERAAELSSLRLRRNEACNRLAMLGDNELRPRMRHLIHKLEAARLELRRSDLLGLERQK